MRLDEYQFQASKTAKYPDMGNNVEYPTLGLCGEAGELANKVKKIQRDGVKDVHAMKQSLSKCLFFLSQIATELNLSLDSVAENSVSHLRELNK